jgi:hypothetical protein
VYQGVIEIHKVGGSTSKPLEQPSPKSVVFSRRERQVSRLSSSRGTCNYALSTHAQTGYLLGDAKSSLGDANISLGDVYRANPVCSKPKKPRLHKSQVRKGYPYQHQHQYLITPVAALPAGFAPNLVVSGFPLVFWCCQAVRCTSGTS